MVDDFENLKYVIQYHIKINKTHIIMREHFYTLLDNHILNLNHKFRDKFSIKQSLYDDIILVLRDGWGNSQFKFWVHKNFKLIKIGNDNIVYEIQSNHPIVTYEHLYTKIKECHENVGHRGRDKTWIQVKKQYAWVPMDSVKLFISQCDICSKGKAIATFPKHLPEKSIVSYEYLTRLQIDLIDMQNMTDGEYKWILHTKDHFTKFSWAYPLICNDTKSIAEKLLQQFYLFGLPQILQSVHGKQFVAKVIKILKNTWTDSIIINGQICHQKTHDLTEDDDSNQTSFKSTLFKWMKANNRHDWSNGLLQVIFSINTSSIKLTNNKTPYEFVFGQKQNYNIKILQILSNHDYLDIENLPCSFIDELKKSTHLLNFVQNTNYSNDSISSSPSNHALQAISKSSLSIQSPRIKYHASSNISTSTKKRRRLTSNSNEEINVFDEDKQSNDNNNKNTDLINNHQQVQPKTNEIVYMTKGQKLFNNTSYKHEYKVGDIVGVIIDKIETVNIELKVLACKILSIELVAEDTNAYQLCTKACIISSRFQASDLLNLCNCNFIDLLTVDPTHLPKLTFNEA
ncbi:unnamed protein product, partial [Rotaria magnacalcarata]